jgi:hypothetical protein
VEIWGDDQTKNYQRTEGSGYVMGYYEWPQWARMSTQDAHYGQE